MAEYNETLATERREFILKIITIIAAMLVCLSPAGCAMYESHLISAMVKDGASPVEARCAMSPTFSDPRTCIVSQISNHRK